MHGTFLSNDQWWECHNEDVQAARNAVAKRYAVDLDYVAWFNQYVPEFNATFDAPVMHETGFQVYDR